MAAVKMPTGEIVEMPDNPTPQQLAELELITSPSGAGRGGPMTAWGGTDEERPWYRKRIPGTNSALVSDKGLAADLERAPSDALRGAKLAMRAPLQGLTGTFGMLGDAWDTGWDALFGTKTPKMSDSIRALADQLGKPETPTEKALDFGGSMAFSFFDPLMKGIGNKIQGPAPLYGPRNAPVTHPLAEKAKTFEEASKLGYVATPNQANAGAGSRALESIVGKTQLEQMAAAKNQTATNTVFTREAGLPPGTPLTTDTLQNAIRATYNAGYDPITRIPTITNGGVYRKSLDRALEEFQGMSKSFPDAAKPEVAKLINAYKVRSFSGQDAIRATQVLRDDASAAFAKGEGQLGKANLAVARAIEDSIELNLQAAGQDAKGILADFRNARTAMAKQYAVKDSLIEGSGSGDLHKLARQLANGAPLTGELRTAAKFANTSPSLARYPKSPPGMFTTPESYMLGAAAPSGLVSGKLPTAAAMAGIPLARAGTRMGMLSGPYQNAFVHPNIDPSILQRLQQHPELLNILPEANFQLGSGLYGQ